MKVLIACEESQRVCIAFRAKGHEAYSCDIQPCSGGHPEWHIQSDVLPLLNGHCQFTTADGVRQGIWKAHFDGKAYAWNSPETAKFRSKTPWGVAKAMAEQWGIE